MAIIQLSIFLENRLGRLQDIVSILGENDINIRALSLADRSEYGILRLIVNNMEKALQILKKENFSVNKTPVIAIEVMDKPGGLAEILNILVGKNLNIEYMYAFVEKSQDKAIVVFKMAKAEEAGKILQAENIRILNEEDIKNI